MTVRELKQLLKNYNDDSFFEIGVIGDEDGDTCHSVDRGESYILVPSLGLTRAIDARLTRIK